MGSPVPDDLAAAQPSASSSKSRGGTTATSSSPPLTLAGEVDYVDLGLALRCRRSEQPPDRLVRHAGPFDVAGGDGQPEAIPEVGEELGSRRPGRLQRVLARPICGRSARAYRTASSSP
ncbi:hypothetical protein [Sorangium sp. So ce233]|uniref:hypothetical protein n=1 Tax=Sorangium sp. So ce233 TaxID=3133290 RepID=UPI003F624674